MAKRPVAKKASLVPGQSPERDEQIIAAALEALDPESRYAIVMMFDILRVAQIRARGSSSQR